MVRLEGCEDHDVLPGSVDHWWEVAEGRGANVSVCACCLSPCPIESAVCKVCINADLSVLLRPGFRTGNPRA